MPVYIELSSPSIISDSVMLQAAISQKSRAPADRAVDLARIARHPGRAHRPRRDAVEMFGADMHLREAARHAEVADEAVEHVAGVFAGMAHRGRDQRLPVGIVALVPAHHRRQHHARGVAMRHVELGAEHVADAVAGAHRHAGRRAGRSRARCRSGNPSAPRCRSGPPSPAAGRVASISRPLIACASP